MRAVLPSVTGYWFSRWFVTVRGAFRLRPIGVVSRRTLPQCIVWHGYNPSVRPARLSPIAYRLAGRRAAVMAAWLLAVTFLHVRDSHFLTVDIPATFWGCLSMALLMGLPIRLVLALHGREQ